MEESVQSVAISKKEGARCMVIAVGMGCGWDDGAGIDGEQLAATAGDVDGGGP